MSNCVVEERTEIRQGGGGRVESWVREGPTVHVGHPGKAGPLPRGWAWPSTCVKDRSRWGQMLEAPENQAEGLKCDVVETPKNTQVSISSWENHWGHNLAHF